MLSGMAWPSPATTTMMPEAAAQLAVRQSIFNKKVPRHCERSEAIQG
jgi:hypothetical protein